MYRKVTTLSRQSAIYGLGTFLNQGLGFFLIPVYTRFLSTAEYGINGSVTAVLGVLSIAMTMGLEAAIARFYYDLDTEPARRHYFGSVWVFLVAFGLAVTLLLDLLGPWLFDLAFQDVPFRPYGRLALWSTYIGLSAVLPTVMFRVREQARTFVAFSVSQFALRIGLNIVTVVYLGQGVVGIFVSMLIANLVFAIPFTWITWKGISLSFDRPQVRASLAYSLPFVPQRLSNWALNLSDRILLENFVSLSALGIYSLGYRFGLMLAALLDAVNLAWAPFYFKTAMEEGGRVVLARMVTYYVFALTFLTLGTVLLSREILVLVADRKFWPAAQVVPPVALAYGCHGLYLAMVAGPSFAKKTARIPLYTGLAALVNIGLNLLFIPRYGVMAAAWSTLLSFLLRAILIAADSVRVFPLPYEYRRLATSLGLGLLLCAGWFVDTGNWWANLAVKSALLAAFPLLLVLGRVLRPDERRGLRRLAHNARVRLTRAIGLSHD